jgi:hypothetical protein
MAHFAQLDANNVVTNVIVVSDEQAPTEAAGQAFIASIGLAGVWKQTSYNTMREVIPVYDDDDPTLVVRVERGESIHRTGGTPFRGQYAGIGDTYNADLDEFVTPPSDDDASA